MGRVAVDFGIGQGAKRSADIQCDLGQASNEGQRQNQRNRRRREASQYFNRLLRLVALVLPLGEQRELDRLPRRSPRAKAGVPEPDHLVPF